MGVEEAEAELLRLVEASAQAEGFTPAVLQELVNALKAREDRLLVAVFQTLADAYRRSDAPDAAVDDAAALLGGQTAGGRKEEKQVARLAAQRRDVCDRISQAQAAADSLQAAAQLQAALTEIDALCQQGRQLQAAQRIAAAGRLHACAAEGGTVGDAEAQLLGAIAQRAGQLAERISSGLQAGVSCAAHAAGAALTVRPSGGSAEAWQALQQLGEAAPLLQQLGGKLLQGLLLPIAAAAGPVSCSSSSGSSSGSAAASLSVAFSPPEAGREAAGEGPGPALLAALDFIAGELLAGDQTLTKTLAAAVWPPLAASLVERRLRPLLGADREPCEGFEAAAGPILELEAAAAERGWVVGDGPIAAAVRAARQAGQARLRLALAQQARALLLAPDRSVAAAGSPLPQQPAAAALGWGGEGAEAPLLAQGCYQISGTGQALAALLRGALQAAAAAGSAAQWEAGLAACCDIAALAGALPPVVHRRELQVPQLAALFRTDCCHLAELLLTAPHCLPEREVGGRAGACLAAEVRRLREAGEQVLREAAARHAAEAAQLLEGAGGFARVHTAQQGIRARKAVQQCLHLLRGCGAAVVPVLPPAAATAFGAAVAGAAAAKAAGDLLAIADISVKESEDLPLILSPLAQEAAAAFAAAAAKRQPADLSAEQLAAAVAAAAPALAKLQALVELLSARLADIAAGWRAGRLAAAGISAAEAEHLVRALFEDTDARQAALRDIRGV